MFNYVERIGTHSRPGVRYHIDDRFRLDSIETHNNDDRKKLFDFSAETQRSDSNHISRLQSKFRESIIVAKKEPVSQKPCIKILGMYIERKAFGICDCCDCVA